MFCPNCRAEYVPGVTACNDCHVPLMPELPKEEREHLVLIWSGEDARESTEVRSTLERKGIPVRVEQREKNYPYQTGFLEFDIYVPAAMQSQAKEALRQANLGDEENWEELVESGALELAPGEESAAPSEPELAEDWNPEDATSEIWAGADSDLAAMIVDSLRENGIASRTENAVQAQKILVVPQDVERAAEIVREIVEATPPQ